VSPLRKDEHETLETLFRNTDLSITQQQLISCYHTTGPGRPPRNPIGILRAFIVMRMKGIRSLRELTRILDVDQRMRRICLIKKDEGGYPRSVLSRFTRRVGAETIRLIIEEKVVMLLRRSRVEEVDAVLDASFLRAWSVRHPESNKVGLSDPDARVGRSGRSFGLGYKLHTSVEPKRILPLANVLAPANENEKRHAPSLVEMTRVVLGKADARLRSLIADSQYSSRRIRSLVERSVIPYMSNQRCGEDVLRVDMLFRVHGPAGEVEMYRRRPAVEALFAFVKAQYGLNVNRVRGLVNVGVYALLSVLCCVLNREAAENLGRPDKAMSPTFFNV
jgi:transposase